MQPFKGYGPCARWSSTLREIALKLEIYSYMQT